MPVINKSDQALMRKVLCVLAAVFAVCLIIGTFFDYQLSTALFSNEQPLAQLLSAVGLLMLSVPLCISFGALMQRILAGMKPMVIKVLLCVVMVFVGCYACAEMVKAIFNHHGIGPLLPFEVSSTISRVLGVLVGLVSMVLGYRAATGNDEAELMQRLTLTVLVLLGVFVIVEVLKSTMHRPRYITLLLEDANVSFQPWYRPFRGADAIIETFGLTSDAFKSFPSSHSAQMGAAAISFYALAAIYPSLRTKWRVVISAYAVLLVGVMGSRIVLGAHFLSDVAVGAGFSVLAGLYLFSRSDIS